LGSELNLFLFFAFIVVVVVVVVVVVIRRERGKSQYKMLESPRRSPRSIIIIVHIIIIIIIIIIEERERERERDKKTKQKKDEKNDAPLSWFLNKSTAWSVILFSSLFSRVFLLKWFILYHTRKQRGEIQHQLLRRR